MSLSVFQGCKAIDVDPAWVRLHTPGGRMQTIPWSAIKLAALPPPDSNITFEGDMSPITQLRDTHDALWIQGAEGLDVVMLEKASPKRAAIIEAFETHLGPKWAGDRMSANDLSMLMFKMPDLAIGGAGKTIKIMVLAMAGIMLLAIVIFFISQARH
jgi:hypothetical protein